MLSCATTLNIVFVTIPKLRTEQMKSRISFCRDFVEDEYQGMMRMVVERRFALFEKAGIWRMRRLLAGSFRVLN